MARLAGFVPPGSRRGDYRVGSTSRRATDPCRSCPSAPVSERKVFDTAAHIDRNANRAGMLGTAMVSIQRSVLRYDAARLFAAKERRALNPSTLRDDDCWECIAVELGNTDPDAAKLLREALKDPLRKTSLSKLAVFRAMYREQIAMAERGCRAAQMQALATTTRQFRRIICPADATKVLGCLTRGDRFRLSSDCRHTGLSCLCGLAQASPRSH